MAGAMDRWRSREERTFTNYITHAEITLRIPPIPHHETNPASIAENLGEEVGEDIFHPPHSSP
jgi:hypothetical protein